MVPNSICHKKMSLTLKGFPDIVIYIATSLRSLLETTFSHPHWFCRFVLISDPKETTSWTFVRTIHNSFSNCNILHGVFFLFFIYFEFLQVLLLVRIVESIFRQPSEECCSLLVCLFSAFCVYTVHVLGVFNLRP